MNIIGRLTFDKRRLPLASVSPKRKLTLVDVASSSIRPFADDFRGTLSLSLPVRHQRAASWKEPNGRQGFEGTRPTIRDHADRPFEGNLNVLVDITERNHFDSFPFLPRADVREDILSFDFSAESMYCLRHNHICVVKRNMSILLLREIA